MVQKRERREDNGRTLAKYHKSQTRQKCTEDKISFPNGTETPEDGLTN